MTTPYTPGGEVAVPIDLTALAIGTRLRTRCGKPARLLATDLLDSTHPCAVAIEVDGCEFIETMTKAGRRMGPGKLNEHSNDIVEVERPKHRVRVQIVRSVGGTYFYATDPARSPGYRPEPEVNETIIADAIVEVEELTPSPAHPGARHDD